MQTHSIRFELAGRPSRNKQFRIYMTVTVGKTRRKIGTPVFVNAKSDFNPKCKNNNWIRKSVPESTVWNAELFDILENARRKFCDLNNDNNIAVTADKVIDRINAKDKSDSFISFMINEQKNIYNSGSLGVWKKYNILVNKLQEYLGGKDLLMADINYDFVKDFDNYLHTLHNERQPADCSIRTQFTSF